MKLIIGKTKITISFWFVAVIIIMFLFCDQYIVFASLLSSLFHETGHLYFMYRYKSTPEKIVFGPFGMRIIKSNGTDLSYKKELFISLGGVIFNLILIVLLYIIYYITLSSYFLIGLYVNIMIVVINSFPIGMLDMGRALKYFLLLSFNEYKAERITELISFVGISLFISTSLIYSIIKGINVSVVVLSIYLLFATLIKKWS